MILTIWQSDRCGMKPKKNYRILRPGTLAQAGRISGITPADLVLLRVHLEGGRMRPLPNRLRGPSLFSPLTALGGRTISENS